MATLTIRNVTETVRDRIKVEAARNSRSMEAEVRALLQDHYQPGITGREILKIGEEFRKATGGFDFEIPRLTGELRSVDFPGLEDGESDA